MLSLLRRARWFFAASLALGVASCLAPTLPLPPPEQPDDVREVAKGTWVVGGSCTKGAIVTVFDVRSGEGVVVEDLDRNGSYVVTLSAKKCDAAWVKEEANGEDSDETPFVIEDLSSGAGSGDACP